MYSKFNCKISDFYYNKHINQFYGEGAKVYEQFKNQSQKYLKLFLLDNGHIDGTAVKDAWFKIQDVDVFISHSHQDEEKVKAFAGWLKINFGLTAFIDSCAWGYCNDLLKQIDDTYCKLADGKTYDYNKRNYSTSHVHAMLSTALLEMIDKTECLIFYNTPQSICLKDELANVYKKKKTLSPWIYQELATVNTISARPPKRYKGKAANEIFIEHYEDKRFNDSATVPAEYDVHAIVGKMPIMDDVLLTQWKFEHAQNIQATRYPSNNKKHSLDELYSLVKY